MIGKPMRDLKRSIETGVTEFIPQETLIVSLRFKLSGSDLSVYVKHCHLVKAVELRCGSVLFHLSRLECV